MVLHRLRWPLILLTLCAVQSQASVPHRKFEYRYSFKPPYLAQKDGSVPFWEYGGNAIASSDNVRVAPSLRSQKGAIWSKSKTTFDWWEVEIIFRISGRGRVGADGLAFWYTDNKGAYDGPVFGSSDKWVGLGLFFDSFDNDNKHNNPYIMAMVNDGTKEFDHTNDGASGMLAGCAKDFRNKPFHTRAKIEYYMNTLTVMFHNGMTNNDQDYEICLRAENVYLPKNGHFGVSAATGGLADDHDVSFFLTTSLYPPGQQPVSTSGKVTAEEENKLTKEYAEYQKQLDAKTKEYKKEHPDGNQPDMDSEDWFENDSQREFRQMFASQNQIYEQVRVLSQKLDEIIGRQERTLGLIGSVQAQGAPVGQHVGVGQPPSDSIRRHEVDALFTNQNSVLNAVRELRNFILELNTKAERIMEKQEKGPTAQVVGYDSMAIVNEVREAINGVKRDTESMSQKLHTTGLSNCPSCVTPLILFLAIFAHLIIIFVYFMYRDNKDTSAKKFY